MFVSNQNKHGSLGPWTISKSAQTADLFNVNNNGGDGEILLCPGRKTHFDCDESRADSRLYPGLAVMKHLTRTSITDYLTFQMFPN